jgi:hypothetical protein
MKKLRTLIPAAVALTFWLPAWGQSVPAAQPGQEPAWPQAFDVQGPLVQTFGFAVTQPGPIVVTVQAQGAPLSLSVEGPLPNPMPPMVQSGVGSLRINYTVTPQDLQRGMFWLLHVGLAQPPYGGRSNGSVSVQHPPVDQAKVMQAVQVLSANRHPLAPAPTPSAQAEAVARARSQREADFKAHVAQIAQRRAQNHAALLAQLQPMLDDMRRRKALVQEAGQPLPPPGSDQVKSRAITPYMQIKRLPPHITGFTVAHEQDPITLPPGSPQYGQPGDPVTISGTGFGNSDGEVHFVIGPYLNQDIVLSPGSASVVWLDNQIFSPVPTVSGYLAYPGAIYLKRLSDGAKSNIVPFQFEPDMEQREIQRLAGYVLAQPDHSVALMRQPYGGDNVIFRDNQNVFSGITGVDRFFANTKLENGWTVAQQPITYVPPVGYGSCGLSYRDGCTGGQSWIQSPVVGTDLLSTSVGFSVNPSVSGNSQYEYMLLIPIQGPRGLPDGQVCVTAPAPNTQCPSSN